VFNALLQILEDGRLTDARVDRSIQEHGADHDLQPGTADLRKSVGFAKSSEAVSYERMKTKVNEALEALPSRVPEPDRRGDRLPRVVARGSRRDRGPHDQACRRPAGEPGLGLELTPAAKVIWPTRLRPDTRSAAVAPAIQQFVEDPLSERILWKEFRWARRSWSTFDNDEIVFRTIEGCSHRRWNWPGPAEHVTAHGAVTAPVGHPTSSEAPPAFGASGHRPGCHTGDYLRQ